MKENTAVKTQDLPAILPDYFSKAGVPTCSIWCKMEIEILAWAYVTGMARDGNTWHKMTSLQCYGLLYGEEQKFVSPYLPDEYGRYDDWWEMIGEQLKNSDGAFEVGGLVWNKVRFKRSLQFP